MILWIIQTRVLIIKYCGFVLDTLHLPRGEVCPKACVFASVHIPLEQPIILWVRAVSRSPFTLRFNPAAQPISQRNN